MNTTLRRLAVLLLLIFAAPLFAASTTPILRGVLQSGLNGAGWNGTNFNVLQATNAELQNLHGTNGTFLWETNAMKATGGGTNDNRGLGSAMFGSVLTTNASNLVTSKGSLLIGIARAGTAGNHVNQIISTGSGNMLIGNIASGLDAVSSKNSIEGAISGSLLIGTVSRRATTNRMFGVNAATAGLLIGSGNNGINELENGTGSLLLGNANGASASCLNRAYGTAVLGLFVADANGTNEVSGASGGAALSVASAAASSTTNIGFGSTLFGRSATQGHIDVSGSASGVAGFAQNTFTLVSSGSPSWVWGAADTVRLGLSASGNNSFALGNGFTNSFSNTFSVGFGAQTFNVRSNGVGIGTNLPQATLHVNGTLKVQAATNGVAAPPYVDQPIGLFGSMLRTVTNSFTANGVYTLITNNTTIRTNGFLASANGAFLTNTVAGFYRITSYGSFLPGNNDTIEVEIFLNETGREELSLFGQYDNPARVRTMSATGILYLPVNTGVSMRVKNTSATAVAVWRGGLTIGTP